MALKICIAIPGFSEASPPDDALQACINLANEFVGSGHDVTVVVSPCTPANPVSTVPAGIAELQARIITLAELTDQQVTAGWFRRRSYEFFNWLKAAAIAFDCVVAPEWQGIAYYAILARQQGIDFTNTRFITYVNAPTQWRYQSRLGRPASIDALEVMFMEREVVRRADAAVISTAGLRDWLTENQWTLPASTQIIPPASTPDANLRTQAVLPTVDTVRPPHADNPPAPVTDSGEIRELVFAGRMDTADGVELFCDGLKLLPADLRDNIKVSFIGAIGEVAQLAGDWYVTRTLRQTGWRYSIKPALSPRRQLQYLQTDGRLAIFTAPAGALPQLLVNCIARHIPVLIPEHCGLRDNLSSEEVQNLCFAPNANALSTKIQTVLTTRDMRLKAHMAAANSSRLWDGVMKASGSAATPNAGHAANESPDTRINPAGSMPLISVCLVHYNRPGTLRQAVDSLKAQTYRNFEVILVDDGSPSSEAQAFLDSLESEFSARKWRIIRQSNQYMWRARNHAAQQARGEYLAFMDDDNIAQRHWLTCALDVAGKTHADIVTSTMTLFHGDTRPDPAALFPMWVPLGACASAGAFMNVFGDAHCLIKRDVFEKLGGFEERYSGYQEDWEFFARAVLTGHKLELIPEPLLFYRISKNSVSRSSDQNWNANRECSMQPYRNAIKPELRDLMAFMLENQRLYCGVMEKRATGYGKMLRDVNRWLRGRAGEAPVVVHTTVDALRAAGAIPSRRRCLRA